MKHTEQLPADGEVIYATALELIGSAVRELRLTMHSDDDPLPKDYRGHLLMAAEKDVKITRIGFGSPAFFEKTADVHITHKNYRFRYSPSSDYRRILMVDRTKVLFKRDGVVFLSDDKAAISEFTKYIDEH